MCYFIRKLILLEACSENDEASMGATYTFYLRYADFVIDIAQHFTVALVEQ